MADCGQLFPYFQGAPLTLKEWINAQNLGIERPEAIQHALIHPGARKQTNPHYERLEFLGDRVLGLVVAELLYKAFPHEKEGELARRFASLVNRDTLTEIAEESGLAQFLEDVIKEDPHSPQRRITILSDTCEALLGALYLEGGITLPHQFIRRYWEVRIHQDQKAPKDPKSALQEYLQKQGKMPEYSVLESSGPAHAPSFVIQVSTPDGPSLQITAGSKREGARLAAQEMLKVLKNEK